MTTLGTIFDLMSPLIPTALLVVTILLLLRTDEADDA